MCSIHQRNYVCRDASERKLYDIWDSEPAFKTLSWMLNIDSEEDYLGIADSPDELNQRLDAWSLDDVTFVCHHITTRVGDCKLNQKRPILPPMDVLTTKTELSLFLERAIGVKYSQGAFIDKDGKPRQIGCPQIKSKLEENLVEAFLHRPADSSGYFQYNKSPELLRNICAWLRKQNRLFLWEKTMTAFEVIFETSFDRVQSISDAYSRVGEENEADTKWALYAHAHDSWVSAYKDVNLALRSGLSVPVEDIIAVNEIA